MAINFASKSRIENLAKITDGGEASIYAYDSSHVLKIYHPKVDIIKKEQKVNYFISIRNKFSPNVIGPEEVVTVNGKFVGYAMKKLTGNEDLHMLTKPKFLAASQLSNQDVLKIVTDLGFHLQKLHDENIIVGDVSDYNFQLCGKTCYFIDVDSWGFIGRYSPDAYTSLFTCPDSYNANGTINFTKENENYNFAVLAFNMLSRIHPFGGIFLPDKNLSIEERMKRKLSIVGAHQKEIKIPKIIGSWKWISPQLEEDFVQIFEHGSKMDITPDLYELHQNMKYCSNHDIYYYGKFSECPLCNENAKVATSPAIVTVTNTTNGPQITIIFAGTDCAYILSSIHYLSKNNEVVHFETGRRFPLSRGTRVEYSNDGKIAYVVSDDAIEVYDENGKVTSTIERMHKTRYLVKDKTVYYVDKGSNLVQLTVTNFGNMPKYLGQVFNPLFEVSDDGKVFVASMYPKKALITTNDYTFEVSYTGKVNEYAINYDEKTNHWLFVYQKPNGKYRTMVFSKNQIEYDTDTILYHAQPISNIDFWGNTLYDPDDGKIIGTNLAKNTAKEFPCRVVDESCKLKFTGRGFKIYGKDHIYQYG